MHMKMDVHGIAKHALVQQREVILIASSTSPFLSPS
jgi:hypothetical protein